MKQASLQKSVEKNLKKGEKYLDFLADEIQKSSRIKVGLSTFFSPVLKNEQKRYQNFQTKYALWARENFTLRRELLFISKDKLEQRKLFLASLESLAKTIDNLFDSWEDSVEGHQTIQTNTLKVTIPLMALIISLFSFIIALRK